MDQNFDPLGELKAMGPLTGTQTGYVRTATGWHKVFWRQTLAMRSGSSLACITACRCKVAPTRIFDEPKDAAPMCADCNDPAMCPPLCATCGDPMCKGVHS